MVDLESEIIKLGLFLLMRRDKTKCKTLAKCHFLIGDKTTINNNRNRKQMISGVVVSAIS